MKEINESAKSIVDETIIAKIIKRGERCERIPIWLMRQAGRSLPEYRRTMKGVNNLMKVCYDTDLIVELTLQPIARFNMDAAIIFSDILVIADVLGCDVNFIRGIGPIIKSIESSEELSSSHEIETRTLPILNAIKKIRGKLPKEKSLIGFAGGPWTVASYIVEGGSSKAFSKVLNFCPLNLERIIERITEATIIYLIKQIESGVDVIQLFDSNAGILSEKLFEKYVIEPTRKIVLAIKNKFPAFPIIGFLKSAAGRFYKDYYEQTNISAISIGYGIPIEWAKENLGVPLQGNLNPSLLAYDRVEAIKEARCIMDCFRDLPFIFNLGHGVLPDTPIENIAALVNLVKNY
ncbi:uroporphyrinogen decarboxylase [Wolbachia endosymbiont of Dirofilaria (Dirofilaria) immitis]|uniref:uroporphyrinogen decarboxylase n=1 Tax=Wolbachia endosymbiont of Dirofilaria (Dirofilaria) immitis TaxID=1812115 RepID=UPI00158F0864|nr:uroporphyrinogen decarboxylase [Wolbachia endosymbiont of Dirofilaria (Dirofilaria) immitis]QKX01992.1 uroporphyrinogen decarboxylase [Wolbachia endosymbiont of Dirofilaria (Dirofilaria) immitis]